LRLTAGCVLMELASPAVSETSVYANGLIFILRSYKEFSCISEVSGNQHWRKWNKQMWILLPML